MNQRWKGWSSFGYRFSSLEDLVLYGQTQPVERKQDDWGTYWTITKGETPQLLKCRLVTNNSINLAYPSRGAEGVVKLNWNDQSKRKELHFLATGGRGVGAGEPGRFRRESGGLAVPKPGGSGYGYWVVARQDIAIYPRTLP